MMQDNLDGRFYHNHSSHQEEWALIFLEKQAFQGSENVLDIGCGDGKISAQIAKQVPHGRVTGIDPSGNMIMFAREQFSEVPNLNFEVSKAEELSFHENFDFVVSFSAFHWVRNQELAFRLILDSMKPDASLKMLFAFLSDYPISLAYRKLCDTYFKDTRISYHGRSRDHYEKLLDQVGFSEWNLSVFEPQVVYEDKEDLTEWLLAWIPSILELNPKKYRAYAEEMTDHICSQGCLRPDGRIAFNYPLLDITAKK